MKYFAALLLTLAGGIVNAATITYDISNGWIHDLVTVKDYYATSGVMRFNTTNNRVIGFDLVSDAITAKMEKPGSYALSKEINGVYGEGITRWTMTIDLSLNITSIFGLPTQGVGYLGGNYDFFVKDGDDPFSSLGWDDISPFELVSDHHLFTFLPTFKLARNVNEPASLSLLTLGLAAIARRRVK